MQLDSQKPNTVYRIVERATGKEQGVYFRGFGDEYDFGSPESARHSNCHGIYRDGEKYAIAKYQVTYELLDPDCDPGEPPKPLSLVEKIMSEVATKALLGEL